MSERDPPETLGTPSTGDLTGDLADARPALDHAAMEDVRARAERALFGRAEPPRLGRFVLLEPIAGGGMGMIHRAYDPQLERPVALKLLHPRQHGTARARARLMAEARVLARLAHPNVVPVYEVLEIEDQVVIVMELVEGKTLAEWERERRRSWREIVEVYVQAGRGLAAAHDLGIVHRDFKPANAIVGDDGRVRVLDFGLARFTATTDAPDGSDDPTVDESPPNLDDGASGGSPEAASPQAHLTSPPRLTVSGEILGTVAYMAPEQLAGEVATAASDQFSFCVSLHRALYGVPPFPGQDAAALLDSIVSGRIAAASGARAPTWLRAIVRRGLAAAPEDRHPSMRAILDQLGRERGWRRWRWAALAAVMAVIALGSIVAARGRSDERPAICDGGAGEIRGVWNATRGQQIRDALDRVGTPYARTITGPILGALDRYRDRWSSVHLAVCIEHRSAPGDLRLAAQLERKRQCLDRRRQDLSSAVEVLVEVNGTSVAKARDVVVGLQPVEQCASVETLPEEADPPTTAAARKQVAEIREQLSRAGTSARGGHSKALEAADRALKAAQRVLYPPAVLEAALAKGSILASLEDFAGAIEPLEMAAQLAHEHRLYHSAVVAGARRIYAGARLGQDLDRLAGWAHELDLLSRGLRADHFARPLLLNYTGVLYMARGERARAGEFFRNARALRVGIDAPDLELMEIDMNLAMITEGQTEREQLSLSAFRRYKDQLGPEHITTLKYQCIAAHYTTDPVIALDLLRDAGDLYRRYHPDQTLGRYYCVAYQAFLTTEIGDPSQMEAAASLYTEAATLTKGSADSDVISGGRLAEGYVNLYRAQPEAALDHFSAVIEKNTRSPEWWRQQLTAEGHLGVGFVEDSLANDPRAGDLERAGHLQRAIDHLERATELFTRLISVNEDVEIDQRLALARFSLAGVLRRQGTGATRGRVRELEAQASAFYLESSPSAYRRQLAALPP